jgi:hypothetical protein
MKNRIPLVACVFALASAPGCLSMQSQGPLDEIQGAVKNASPWVEGWIEYPGPKEKWAGPTTFVLHVRAKDAAEAQISVSPALFRPSDDVTTSARAPASARKGLSGDAAREYLSHVAVALQGADAAFRGCLSPVRVRLLRADGTLLEKSGCRGQNGWSRSASESVNYFLTATLEGMPDSPASLPAAHEVRASAASAAVKRAPAHD